MPPSMAPALPPPVDRRPRAPPAPHAAAAASGAPSPAGDGKQQDEKKFWCAACGSRFHTKLELKTHLRSAHAGGMRWSAPAPAMPASTPRPATPTPTPTLAPAPTIAKGGGERPYACPQCPSRFRRSSDRNRHVRMVHAKKRPFQCEQCGSLFGRKSYLDAHVSTVHLKRRPFRCFCGATFGQRSSLTRHAKKIHANADGAPPEGAAAVHR